MHIVVHTVRALKIHLVKLYVLIVMLKFMGKDRKRSRLGKKKVVWKDRGMVLLSACPLV